MSKMKVIPYKVEWRLGGLERTMGWVARGKGLQWRATSWLSISVVLAAEMCEAKMRQSDVR